MTAAAGGCVQVERVNNAMTSKRFLGDFVLVAVVVFFSLIFLTKPFYKSMHEGNPHPYGGGAPVPGEPMAGVVMVASLMAMAMAALAYIGTLSIFSGLLFIFDGLQAVSNFMARVCCQNQEERKNLLFVKKNQYPCIV